MNWICAQHKLNRIWVIRSDFPVVVIRSGFQNLSLSSFIIGLCMPDIGWLVCRFAVCRIFPALKTQAGKPRANEHALFPSTLQAACGNESTPVSEMATSQWSQATDAEWTLRCHHSSLCCRLRKLSHFSREYSRMFGESPKRDITRLRKSVGQL